LFESLDKRPKTNQSSKQDDLSESYSDLDASGRSQRINDTYLSGESDSD
jgi:hypothetical protein